MADARDREARKADALAMLATPEIDAALEKAVDVSADGVWLV